MERARLDAGSTQIPESTAQFPGCPVRERHSQGAARIVRSGHNRVGDAVGDGPRLAGARTSQDHDRPFEALGDGTLFVVEPGEHFLRIHGPMLARPADTGDHASTGT